MAMRSSVPSEPPDAAGFGWREVAFDGGFWTRLAMGCGRLPRTLTEASAPLQDRPGKGPNRAGFPGQSDVAIGPLTAIVRAISMTATLAAAQAKRARGHRDQGDGKMFVTPAFAQGNPLSGLLGGDNMLMQLLPFVLIFVIMYFLILRPQQKRAKDHQELVKNLRRGDTVITSGGLMGKVTKVVDDEQIEVEIADGVRVRQVRSMVSGVRAKGEPVKDDAS
jgi:preprotein translocase subunit YajC